MLGPVDLEAVYVDLLGAHTRVPNPRPAEFTRVTRSGGGGPRNVVQTDVRLLVECFAASETAAFDRARIAWATIWANQRTTVGGAWIAVAELTEPVNYPDPTTNQARYQFVAQLTTTLQEIA